LSLPKSIGQQGKGSSFFAVNNLYSQSKRNLPIFCTFKRAWYMAMEINNKSADWIYLPLSFFVIQLEIFFNESEIQTRIVIFVLKESI
jgi:hypothetical protein